MPFQKGQSGNAAGARIKSQEQRDFEAKCREWCRDFAFHKLKKKADSEDEKISSWATEVLLNRAFGKPVETSIVDANVTSDTGNTIQELADGLAGIVGNPAPGSGKVASEVQVDPGK